VSTTSAASAFAFALGCLSPIPAIQAFCAFAAISVLTVYIMMLSFFLSCYVLTEKRIAANRNDCLCCAKGGCQKVSSKVQGDGQVVAQVSGKCDLSRWWLR
jgi:Sterol-sensing domain of SREBP cleavage-activation